MIVIMRFISDHIILSMRPVVWGRSPRMNGIEYRDNHIFTQDFPVNFGICSRNIACLHRRRFVTDFSCDAPKCLDRISVEQVLGAVERLLSDGAGRPRRSR